MAIYICEKCGYSSTKADNIWKHLTKKRPCSKEEVFVNIETMSNYAALPTYVSKYLDAHPTPENV